MDDPSYMGLIKKNASLAKRLQEAEEKLHETKREVALLRLAMQARDGDDGPGPIIVEALARAIHWASLRGVTHALFYQDAESYVVFEKLTDEAAEELSAAVGEIRLKAEGEME